MYIQCICNYICNKNNDISTYTYIFYIFPKMIPLHNSAHFGNAYM